MYDYQVDEILVATWSEDGTRHAAARVLENSIRLVKVRVKAEGEKKADLVEQRTGKLQLLTYPSGEPPREVTLSPAENPDLVKLTGPRGWAYFLTEPNAKERITCEGVIARAEEQRKAEEAKPKRVVPEAFKRATSARKASGAADKAMDAMRQASGATKAQIMALTGWLEPSVRGFVSTLRSKGTKVESGKDRAGNLTYRIVG